MKRLLKNHPKALSFYLNIMFTLASILLWPGKKLLNHLTTLQQTYLRTAPEATQTVEEPIVVTVDEVVSMEPEVSVVEEMVSPVQVVAPVPPTPPILSNSELLNAIKIIQKHLAPEEKPRKTINPPMIDKKFVEVTHAKILAFRNNKLQLAPTISAANDAEFDYAAFIKNSHARIINHRVKKSEHTAEKQAVAVQDVGKSPFFEVNYDVSKLNLNKLVTSEVMAEKPKQSSAKANIKVKRKG